MQRLGDGSMSMFPSSLAAVQAAVATQQELAAQEVLVRIGVHAGEVVVEPERLTGDAVNVAARIESFAEAGAVLVSDAVFEQIKNQSEVAARRAGTVQAQERGPPVRAVRRVGARRSWCPIRGRSRARASGSRACRATSPRPLRRSSGAADEVAALAEPRPGASASSRSPGPAGSGRRACWSSSGTSSRPTSSIPSPSSRWPTWSSRRRSCPLSRMPSTSRRQRAERSSTASSR